MRKKARPHVSKHHGSRELRRLGKNLAARWRQAGLSQTGLVKEPGLSKEHLSLLEQGRRNPPYTTLLLIARALKTKVAKLVPH